MLSFVYTLFYGLLWMGCTTLQFRERGLHIVIKGVDMSTISDYFAWLERVDDAGRSFSEAAKSAARNYPEDYDKIAGAVRMLASRNLIRLMGG